MEPLKTMICRVCGVRKELRHFRSLKAMIGRPEKKCLCKDCQTTYIKRMNGELPFLIVFD